MNQAVLPASIVITVPVIFFALSLTMGMLRTWTLAIIWPSLIPFGIALNFFGFHPVVDILGAFPLVVLVYGLVYPDWTPPKAAPPLDSRAGSS